MIRTKNLKVSRREFLDAWARVEVPAGCAWDMIVQASRKDPWRPRLGSGTADRIARLFRAAALAHAGQPFPADERRVADSVAVARKSWRDGIKRVMGAGLVTIVKPGVGKLNSRIATVWHWQGPK